MHAPAFLLIPLTCALLYVFSMLAMKRAADFGVGVWRTAFCANWAAALFFLPVWFVYGRADLPWTAYWQPATAGLVFLLAQVCMFLAVTRGDVSVAAPVLGLKVVLVALFSSLLRVGDVPAAWWAGAGLSTLGVALLNLGGGRSGASRTGPTVAIAGVCAVLFSLSDVLIQKWASVWGPGQFLPPMFLLVGFFSFLLLGFSRGVLADIRVGAWRWVGLGALFNGLTHFGISLTLAIWGHATAVNVVYSIRGLFSVLLVWWIGHWFTNTERHAGRRVHFARLAGAAAMLGAIALVLA